MSEHMTEKVKGLPENAYMELKPGEEYVPIMKADQKPAEVTPYSVIIGLLMAVLFSAAAAYLAVHHGSQDQGRAGVAGGSGARCYKGLGRVIMTA